MKKSSDPIPTSDPLAGSPVFAPPISRRDVPTAVLVIQGLLALAAIIMATLFVSFLLGKYDYRYAADTMPLAVGGQDAPIIESDALSEAELIDVLPPIFATYDFSKAVPESEAMPRDYFNDTVFIGDSRTAGLLLYTNLSPIDFSATGLNIRTILTKAFIRLPNAQGVNQSYKLIDALKREEGNYKAIYLSMGLNELGWEANGFIEEYRKTVHAIREVTDVPIYMQLIMPVTVESSETSPFGITNEKAIVFNEELIKLAEEMELFMLDPRHLFALEDGTLDPEVTFDGVHLNPKRYEAVADYYCTHVVDMEAYENLRSEPDTEGIPDDPSIEELPTDPSTEDTAADVPEDPSMGAVSEDASADPTAEMNDTTTI